MSTTNTSSSNSNNNRKRKDRVIREENEEDDHDVIIIPDGNNSTTKDDGEDIKCKYQCIENTCKTITELRRIDPVFCSQCKGRILLKLPREGVRYFSCR